MTKPARSGLGTARRGRVMAVLVVVAVGLTMVAGGAAEAKDSKKVKAKAAIFTEVAAIQAKVDANTRQYTGTVDGTNAYVAVLVSGKDVRVYICDGNALSAWFQGKVAKDGGFEAEAATGNKISGTISGTAAAGTVTLADGSEHAFTAPLATSPAGLYERLPAKDASGELVSAATIVLPDGTQRGAARPVNICDTIRSSRAAWLKSWQVAVAAGNIADQDEAVAGYAGQDANLGRHGCTRN